MALGFEVCQLRATSYSASANNSGGKKSATISFTQRYLVKATGISSPDEVTDLQVAYANGIPLVNYHTWYDPHSGLGYPMAVCSSKTVKRIDSSGFNFHVDVTYKTEPPASGKDGKETQGPTEESPDEPPTEPPENASDIDPKISRTITSREIVLYEAPAYSAGLIGGGNVNGAVGGVDGVPVSTRVMPSTGNKLKEMFDIPVTRNKPLLSLSITQFEDDFSNATMMNRCLKVNNAEWAGFPSKSCMITNINAVKQSVSVVDTDVNGDPVEPREIVPRDMFRVTYTVLYDDYSVRDSSGNTLFVGHAAALPLISRSFIDDQNSNVPKMYYIEELALGNVGLNDISGHPLTNQSGAPDYVMYDTVDEIDFSFLPDDVDI